MQVFVCSIFRLYCARPHALSSPLFIVRCLHKSTGKQSRVQKENSRNRIHNNESAGQGRELGTPLGANGLSCFSVPWSMITPARDGTRDWQAWEKWITGAWAGKGEAAGSYEKTEGIKTKAPEVMLGEKKNNITQRHYYPFPINNRRQHVWRFHPFGVPLQNVKWLPS